MSADDDAPGVPEWVVTYGDMMSLLLTFFIMLVSMSELKEEGRIRAMLDAIREAFGPGSNVSGVPGPSLQTRSIYTKRNSEGFRSEGETKRAGGDSAGTAGAFRTVERINHGTVVTLGGPAAFGPHDAELNDALRAHLDIVAESVGARPNRIVVRGHTSALPLQPGSIYRDHLDLSFARAEAVASYLVEKGVDAKRIVVSAVGATEPRRRTRDASEQLENHRVDVFLVDAYIPSPKPVETD